MPRCSGGCGGDSRSLRCGTDAAAGPHGHAAEGIVPAPLGAGAAPTGRAYGAPYGAPAIGGDVQMAINGSNQCEEFDGGCAATAAEAAAGSRATVDDAWESLGMRTRRYIIMQHGQIDLGSARDASDLPWAAVRGAIEDANDEFDGSAAEAAILATAGLSTGGGQG